MPSYLLVEVEVLDPDMYHQYIDSAFKIIKRHGGDYMFRSEDITPLSGNWTPRRLVLIRFNSKTDIHRCFNSEAYLRIKHLREQSTISRSVIIDQDTDAFAAWNEQPT